MRGLTSTSPGDLDLLLVGPGGQNAVIMSDVGGGGDVTNITLLLSDAAAAPMTGATLVSGTFKPTNLVGLAPEPDTWPAPAPAASGLAALSVFNGFSNANGTWSLYVFDDTAGDVHTFASGWDLTITQAGGAGCPSPTPPASPTPTLTPTPTPPAATPTPTCVPNSQVFAATLNGTQEVPPTGSAATGWDRVLNQAQTMITVDLDILLV